MTVFDRTLRNPRYRQRGIVLPRCVDVKLKHAALVSGALALALVGGALWYYHSSRCETRSAVENCAATWREYGDELFLDAASARSEIARLGSPGRASRWLTCYVQDSGEWSRYRWVAISMLGHCGKEANWTVPWLRKILFDANEGPMARSAAAFSMARISTVNSMDVLTVAVRSKEAPVREYAAKALARSSSPGAEDGLLLACADPDEWIRLVAVRALGRAGTARSLEMLVELKRYDTSPRIRQEARRAHWEVAKRSGRKRLSPPGAGW